MEPLKLNLFLIGEVVCLVGFAATLIYMASTGIVSPTDVLITLGVGAILCSLEGEQYNAE